MKPLLAPAGVFVIGGGPAGLAAAIAARERGLDGVVSDCAVPPVNKACGEGIMPDVLAAAPGLGIELPDAGGFRFHGIGFHDRGHSVDADFPNGRGLGLRRMQLHDCSCNMPSGLACGSIGACITGSGAAGVYEAFARHAAMLRAKGAPSAEARRYRLAEVVLYCFAE